MKPVRVLYVSGGSLDHGGIASWMLNFASQFDRDRIAVDFLMHGMEPGARENEATALGAKVYHVPYRRSDPVGNRREMGRVISGGYDIVHAHMDGMNAYPLGLAKRFGVKMRISHSHNTDFLTANPARRLLHVIARARIPQCATHLLACSEAAAVFLYGRRLVKQGNVKIVRNAIDIERYAFDADARTRVRDEFGFDSACVIGHVGRFDLRQKNQLFMIKAFSEAKKLRSDLKLVFVGDGKDRSAIEAYIQALGLNNDVVLTGFRDDVPALMSAFDAFALPSHFEGLGIVLIEAQANGLPCVASAEVPHDTMITDCTYLALSDREGWVRFLENVNVNRARALKRSVFTEHGYDIRSVASELSDFYLEGATK